MKEIDDYLGRLYKSLNITNQEISELRVEMKSHLLETVHELEAEGKSPQESVRIAIERFGDAGQINRELPKIMMISRKRLSRLFIVICGVVLALIICLTFVFSDNVKKQEKLALANSTMQTIIEDLKHSKQSLKNYNRIFEQVDEYSSVFENSANLSKDLNARYNTAAIDQIAEMNKTFRYHNTLLKAIVLIAANTGYECPYFKDIANLAVMKLSNTYEVIELAEKACDAQTEEDKEFIKDRIRKMKDEAEFKTYEQALDYNRSYKNH